jgi:dinuclear metal center YbgI/SA1388 family protein
VTSVRVGDIAALLDEWFPPELAEDWDVVGLTVGSPEASVRRIRLAVEPTHAVVAEAAGAGADLVITHHPLLLRSLQRVRFDEPKGALIEALIRRGVSLFVAHTNADAGRGGVGDALAETLGLNRCRPLEPAAGALPEPGGLGLGRVGELDEPIPLQLFAQRVAEVVPATAGGIRVAGDPDRPIQTVALLPGAGDSLLDAARGTGADVYLTSDLRHHPTGDALAWTDAPALVDVPHWAAEWVWLPALRARLTEALTERGTPVPVDVSELVTDPWTLRLR